MIRARRASPLQQVHVKDRVPGKALDPIPCPMPDVKDLNFVETLDNATDDTIHMWFAAVK